MGIHLNLAVILHEWCRRYQLSGPALTLGVQETQFTHSEFQRAVGPAPLAPPEKAGHEQQMTANDLFAAAGVADLRAMDVSDFEGAEILFDLNKPQPPPDLLQRFGLIINGGTLEHVFHVPNALANLGAMLAPRGAILHVLPCNNWVDHGFYQFSPTLVFDYYTAMGYEVLESAMAIFNPRRNGGHDWEVRAQPVGAFGFGRGGQLDDRTYLLLALVRRGAAAPIALVPTQSFYAGRPARPSGGPRWFSTYELRYGTRIDHPNRGIYPLRDFNCDDGHMWRAALPELEHLADSNEAPTRSPVVVLEDSIALGPAHQSHAAVRLHGGGGFSHWGATMYLSTRDGSDPNTNGRAYTVVVPGPTTDWTR